MASYDEMFDAIADRFEAIEKENRALKKQLGAINPELLEDMKTTMDSAQAMHSVIKTERAQMSEQNLQQRKLREEQNAAFEARHRNAMEAMRKQTLNLYDSQAETQAMLQEIKSGREEYDRLRQSAQQSITIGWSKTISRVVRSWSDLRRGITSMSSSPRGSKKV